MQKRFVKFGIGIAILAGSVVWLGMSGYEEGKSYFKTADEYVRLDSAEQHRRIRLMGEVVAGSIVRSGQELSFVVALNNAEVPVIYTGTDLVPDTFQDGASVLVEGSAGEGDLFEGKKIQAKCASKYEADPAEAYRQPDWHLPTAGSDTPASSGDAVTTSPAQSD